MAPEDRVCQNCKNNFIIEANDFGFYEKIKVPPPTFCPDCRRQRRWAWRNNMSLYNRKCELCDKSVVSLYAPSSPIPIYCNKCWWSDKWDPKSYGVDYDFSKPFFLQAKELRDRVPHMAIVNDDGIASKNCEYSQDWWFSKNCYMCFSGWHAENVMYSFFILAGNDIMDSYGLFSKNEFIYELIRGGGSYRVKYSQFAKSCIDSSFTNYCSNCSDCLMCDSIQNKKYYFKNKEYSKEEYEKILASYQLDTYSGVEKAKKEYQEFLLTIPHRYVATMLTVNCTGDSLSTSKNSKFAFIAKNLENCSYIDLTVDAKDCRDLTTSGELSECCECVVGDHSQLNKFGYFSVKSQNIEYNQHCHNCKYIFGCIGLRNASYCILNKQFSKEEYEELVPKIKIQMNEMPFIGKDGITYKYGEFFPTEHSPFGYNESYAPEISMLTESEAKQRGYGWQNNTQKTIGKETLLPQDIPESINNVDEKILDEILRCINCSRNYKIVPNELIFYKKMSIPIPRKCFSCRYYDRLTRRNPLKLWSGSCMCNKNSHFHGEERCEVKFETIYSPDRPEIVYCEKCYQAEVY